MRSPSAKIAAAIIGNSWLGETRNNLKAANQDGVVSDAGDGADGWITINDRGYTCAQ
jgi:hypothetical protein